MALRDRTIAVAGMPRSGSTWQFNATRLLIEDTGIDHWSGWIEDFGDTRAPVKLVKVHQPEHLDERVERVEVVLTTFRPFEECLSSLIRMGWLEPDRERVRKSYDQLRSVYQHWAARSDHETSFESIGQDPVSAIAAIQQVLSEKLDFPCEVDRPDRVNDQLSALIPEPVRQKPGVEGDGGFNPVSLLHPGHIRTEGESQDYLDDIVAWIADLD